MVLANAIAPNQEKAVFSIPESKDEAVKVSAAALLGQVKQLKGAKKAKKGFGAGSSGGSTGTRFSVELPLASDSPAELAGLAADLLAALPAAATAGACIVAASEQVAAAVQAARSSSGRQGSGPVLSLRAACQADSLSGPLLLLAPATSDVALVEQLLDEVWGGPWALVVNPGWHANTPAAYSGLVDSFEAAYSFMPIATQGLVRAEGAVLRQLSGSAAASPWRVLLKEGDDFVQVGQMKRRPSQSDLELVIMNARAASSPLTSLVKGVKGLMGKGKK
ncbi:hypothetical protein OEZ86_010097 [Tetradesmus obliquus]|uniref:DUF1995 domain-containing protein n=1 Tax=Tetradesmus obliquus TaxID=3088 RepID=A0ABY8UQJ0_TETOB|nr:hypothetical protein OEZ85_001531 [Tetradesmus obliquus]WIA43659.1 hypothetical protein OEZ86_010097 [Tetradesmus obliquus]